MFVLAVNTCTNVVETLCCGQEENEYEQGCMGETDLSGERLSRGKDTHAHALTRTRSSPSSWQDFKRDKSVRNTRGGRKETRSVLVLGIKKIYCEAHINPYPDVAVSRSDSSFSMTNEKLLKHAGSHISVFVSGGQLRCFQSPP